MQTSHKRTPLKLFPFIALLGLIALSIYAWLIEPERIEVTNHAVNTDGIVPPIRIVQLSDLHLQSIGSLEKSVASKIAQLKPDR